MSTTIIERIETYLSSKGINVSKAEKDIGLSNASLSKPFKNKTSIKTDTLEKFLKKYTDINPVWLLYGHGKMLINDSIEKNVDLVSEPREDYIPLIPIEVIAGMGNNDSAQINKSDIIDGYIIPEFTQKGVEYIIRVSGSSMYPKYSSGDLLGCKNVNDKSFFQWGKVYVLDTDQGPMVKRLFPVDVNDNILECRSDNKDYPPFHINKSSIFKIAIVLGVLRIE